MRKGNKSKYKGYKERSFKDFNRTKSYNKTLWFKDSNTISKEIAKLAINSLISTNLSNN